MNSSDEFMRALIRNQPLSRQPERIGEAPMSESNSERAEPNLTPLLDMVFQLITFFMLVINFKGASLDMSLKLPVLGSARPLDKHGKLEPLLLNIDTEG